MIIRVHWTDNCYLNLETEVLRIPVVAQNHQSVDLQSSATNVYTTNSNWHNSGTMWCVTQICIRKNVFHYITPFPNLELHHHHYHSSEISAALLPEYLIPTFRRVIEDALSIKIHVVHRTALSTLLPTTTTILLISTSHRCNCIHLPALCKCHTQYTLVCWIG